MYKNKGTLSTRQGMLLFLTTIYSITVWTFPSATTQEMDQVAWLVPIPATLFFLYLIKQLNYLIVQNPDLSLLEAFEKCTNRIIGKLFATLFLIFLLLKLCIYSRFISERLLSSVFPHVHPYIFIISLLIIVSFTSKYGITVIARMSNLIVPFATIILGIILMLLIPNISIEKITPVTNLNILTLLKTSMILISSYGPSLIIVFIFSDIIVNKKNLMKEGKQISFYILIITMLLLISSIGTFGHYTLKNIPISYFEVLKQIKIFEIWGFESIFVTIWVVIDYISLTIHLLAIHKLLKYIFNFKHLTFSTNLLLIFVFVFGNLFSKNFDLAILVYGKYVKPLVNILGSFLPILMVWIYRIRFRKKIKN